MRAKPLLLVAFSMLTTASFSQILFTYGKQAVDAQEFLRAFKKNNTTTTANKAKAMNEYLAQYIKSRLRMAEAYERRYDTLTNIKTEVANLRSQIIENYLSDPGFVTKMVNEAFTRSQKDVRFAHIFISFRNPAGIEDTTAATTKKNDVLSRLNKGEDFLQLAQQLSDDPSARLNKGDGGFITVFTLPYEFENAIYNTAVGKFSQPIRSKSGYHIFKKLEERKAAGKMKAQQILLAIPPEADEAARKELSKRADSIYKVIVKGGNFSELATLFSNDYISSANSGNMPEISVGQYDAVFEKSLWSLTKDGAVSKPFLTSHGWHILKRVSAKPVVTSLNDKANYQELQQRVMSDGRWKVSKNFIYDKVKASKNYKPASINMSGLYAWMDSLLDYKTMLPAGRAFSPTTTLFLLGQAAYDANGLLNYARSYRYKTDGTGVKTTDQLLDEWTKSSMYDYYKSHLEDFNEDFRNQMKEFVDGNLFFEIMQQEVWNKAQADSAALISLYNSNKKNYMWKQSAAAVIFFCSDSIVARQVYTAVKANPKQWRTAADQFIEQVIADSSRYEWEQIPNLNRAVPKAGMLTTPLINKNDNTTSFAYIIETYPQPMQRSYQEAKGLVINDYQQVLENKWDEELAKKFPVVIDKAVMAKISK